MHEELGKHEIRIKIKQDLVINHSRHDEAQYRIENKKQPANNTHQKETYSFDIDEINKFIDEHVEAIYQHMKTERTPYKRLYFREKFPVNWQTELMYLPFTPKEPISHFAKEGGTIFMSKKKPLLILCKIANERESEAALEHQDQRRRAMHRHGSLMMEEQ